MEKITWETVKRKISDLKGYNENPRNISKDQFEQLKTSIDKFGYVEIVAIDLDNTIVAGHMRIKALKSLKRGSEIIDVRIPSRKLTEEEFREYLIRSNLNIGTWDYDGLANTYDALDLLKYGFTEEQLLGLSKEDIEGEEGEEKKKKKSKECPSCGHKF